MAKTEKGHGNAVNVNWLTVTFKRVNLFSCIYMGDKSSAIFYSVRIYTKL